MIDYYERRPAVGCNGPYECNRRGDIFNAKTGMKIKLRMSKKGYLIFTGSCKGIRETRIAHRITALTFIPNEHNFQQINHINGDKTDNRVENLEWCTCSHNNKHAYRVLWRVSPRKGKPKAKGAGRQPRPVRGVHKQTGDVLEFASIHDAARRVGGNACDICASCRGRLKSASGYRWEYAA